MATVCSCVQQSTMSPVVDRDVPVPFQIWTEFPLPPVQGTRNCPRVSTMATRCANSLFGVLLNDVHIKELGEEHIETITQHGPLIRLALDGSSIYDPEDSDSNALVVDERNGNSWPVIVRQVLVFTTLTRRASRRLRHLTSKAQSSQLHFLVCQWPSKMECDTTHVLSTNPGDTCCGVGCGRASIVVTGGERVVVLVRASSSPRADWRCARCVFQGETLKNAVSETDTFVEELET